MSEKLKNNLPYPENVLRNELRLVFNVTSNCSFSLIPPIIMISTREESLPPTAIENCFRVLLSTDCLNAYNCSDGLVLLLSFFKIFIDLVFNFRPISLIGVYSNKAFVRLWLLFQRIMMLLAPDWMLYVMLISPGNKG